MLTRWKPGTPGSFFSLASVALGHAPVLASGHTVTGRNGWTETVYSSFVFLQRPVTPAAHPEEDPWESLQLPSLILRCTSLILDGIRETTITLGHLEDVRVSLGPKGPMDSSRCELAW